MRMPGSFASRSEARILREMNIKKTLKGWPVKRVWAVGLGELLFSVLV